MSRFAEQLEELRREYFASLPEQALKLQAAQAVSDGEQLLHLVHKLAGNSAAFRQMDIALLASHLDEVLSIAKENGAIGAAVVQDCAADLQRLCALLSDGRGN